MSAQTYEYEQPIFKNKHTNNIATPVDIPIFMIQLDKLMLAKENYQLHKIILYSPHMNGQNYHRMINLCE